VKLEKMLFGCACLFICSIANAQFEAVVVKMQDGTARKLTDIPWFKLFAKEFDKHKDRATNADWLIASPPKYCSSSFNYRVQWQGPIASYRQNVLDTCSKRQRKSLEGMPAEAIKVCDCEMVIEAKTNMSDGKAEWVSLNDDVLMNDEFKLRRTFILKSEELPVLLSFSERLSAVYDFKGNNLCTFNIYKEPGYKPNGNLRDMLEMILRNKDKSLNATCFDSMKGELDISNISYNIFNGKITGDAKLQLQSGEKYVLKAN